MWIEEVILLAQNRNFESFSGTQEERQLLLRARDLAERANRQYCACCTPFLSPAEQLLLTRWHRDFGDVQLNFEGGYPDAERKIAVFTPSEFYGKLQIPIDVLALKHGGPALGHRDILGALMSLGIKRDRIGDILDGCSPPLVICDAALSDYIISELKKAGRANLVVTRSAITHLPEQQYKEYTGTVASMRLDCIVAEGFRISRARAADQIRRGMVQLNWQPCDNCSREVAPGDRISLRGSGKIEVSEVGSRSRKGRIFLTVRHY